MSKHPFVKDIKDPTERWVEAINYADMETIAAFIDDPRITELLSVRGSRYPCNSVLTIVAWRGEPDLLERLLLRGADPDSVDGENGYTALITAVNRKHVGNIEVLLRYGASVDIRDGAGYTALMRACGGAPPEIAERLLESGADPNIPCQNGTTPLMHAAFFNQEKVARLLLRAGAKINVRAPKGNATMSGYTAIELARKMRASGVLTAIEVWRQRTKLVKAVLNSCDQEGDGEDAGLDSSPMSL